jgi:hypothetical protein
VLDVLAAIPTAAVHLTAGRALLVALGGLGAGIGRD